MTRLKFQGYQPYPPADKVDDWGLTPEQQETHVEQFRQLLDGKGLWRKDDHDYYTLLRFLRARNYEHDKAFKMWSDTLAWRKEFDVDAILDNFVFHERELFLGAYPQGYHKTDKLGRPIYIQMLGKIDITTLKRITTEERMVKFHIQEYERCGQFIFPVCSRLAGRQVDQTFGIMDVKGVGLSHLTGEVKRLVSMLTKYDQDNYPEMLGRICIINAPMVFRGVWALIKPMLNPRTLNKIQICQSNYSADLLQWVDAENLPEWLGGKSKGTLLDDVGPWSDPEVLQRLQGDLPAAGRALKALRASAPGGAALLEDAEPDGYQSPKSESSFVSALSTSSSLNPEAFGQNVFARASLATLDKKSLISVGSHPQPQQQHMGRAHGDGEAEGGGSEHNALIAAVNTARAHSLMDRVQALEQLYAQQMQRLKGYMPAAAFDRVAERRMAAPEGSLLARVDALEEALELLLRAQDLAWQEEERRRARDGCCGGCAIC